MTKSTFRYVEWSNAACTIRFKTAQPAEEPFDLRQILRAREPITRSKLTIRGKVPDKTHGCMHHCESHNEIKAAVILVAAAHADVLKMQPFELIYHNDGKKCRYFPDALLAWGNELWVVEVKDDKKADDPREKARYQVVADLLATHRIRFHLWKRSEICSEPRLSTARSILRYQNCPVSPMQREQIRARFSENPVISLGSLTDDEIRLVLRFVVEGTLHIDWSSRLSRMSWVSVSPIGEQIWPVVCKSANLTTAV